MNGHLLGGNPGNVTTSGRINGGGDVFSGVMGGAFTDIPALNVSSGLWRTEQTTHSSHQHSPPFQSFPNLLPPVRRFPPPVFLSQTESFCSLPLTSEPAQSNPLSSHRLNYSAAKSPNQVTNDFDQE